MKKLLLLFVLTGVTIFGCSSSDESSKSPEPSESTSGCGTYNGHTLQKGEQGGCYYVNSSGNKTYVDRSLCKC